MANEIHMERIAMRTENELTMRNLRNLNQELQAQVREVKAGFSARRPGAKTERFLSFLRPHPARCGLFSDSERLESCYTYKQRPLLMFLTQFLQ